MESLCHVIHSYTSNVTQGYVQLHGMQLIQLHGKGIRELLLPVREINWHLRPQAFI